MKPAKIVLLLVLVATGLCVFFSLLGEDVSEEIVSDRDAREQQSDLRRELVKHQLMALRNRFRQFAKGRVVVSGTAVDEGSHALIHEDTDFRVSRKRQA